MNARIVIRLWLAIALFGVETLVWSFGTHDNGIKQTTARVDTAATTPLPAVLLPSIDVHPDAATLAELVDVPMEGGSLTKNAEPITSFAQTLPRVRLSMPYYSFGRLLPRANKE